jgi:phage FluMu gp28-like protein
MVTLNARPHAGQKAVHDHPARFRVLAGGRRWGKTRLGVWECLQTAATSKGRAWWIAPSYKTAAVGWRPLSRMGGSIPGAEVKHTERLVTMPGGGSVQVRSADDPDSLRGEGLDLCILDEASFVNERAWTEAIRPALSDRGGKALFISTPAGRNWFYRLHQRGQEGKTDWQSFSFPTHTNPYVPNEEIEAARQDLPERIFAQEYEAAFLDDAGGVFRRVLKAVTDEGDTVPEGGRYVIGCDWGRTNDATVFCVVEINSGYVVEVDRMTQTDYQTQVTRLQALHERYGGNADIIAENNSMGSVIVEALISGGLPVIPFTTTNSSKAQIIDGLALAFERGDIRIPRDPTLIGELQAFESKRLASGAISYAAPSGLHDDCVIALALAWSAREDASPLVLMHI